MAAWAKRVYTKGIRQKLDPEGVGYRTRMPDPLTPEQDAQLCDRHFNPAIITTAGAFDAEFRGLPGTFEGPGFYKIVDGAARKIWGPGDLHQGPHEDEEPWLFRIGELQPREEKPLEPGGFPKRGNAHATVVDVARIEETLAGIAANLELLHRKVDELG